jgi:hypothetical protein
MTIQEQINQIIIRLNQISNNAKNINQLNPATSGEKWLGVFNEATNTTEKVNLSEITSQSGLPDGVVQLGSINLVDEEVTFTTGFTWRIDGILYFNFEQVFEIPLAADSRIDIFVLTDAGTILRLAGVDNETPIAPAVPVGTIFLTQILVTDTAITPPVEPDLNGFIQKIFASFDKWATNEITLSLDGRTNFIANTALANFKGFNFPSPNDNFYEGKPFILFNNSGANIVVEEDSADVDLPFAEGYTHENGKLILFVPVLGKLHMVGSAGGTTIHNVLTGRDASDAHPISAITGLAGALDAKLETVNTNNIANHAVTNAKLAQMNANTYKGRSSGNGTPQDLSVLDLPISTAAQTALNAKIDKTAIQITKSTNFNASGETWNGSYVELNIGANNITLTINVATNVAIRKIGTGTLTIVSGVGRNLISLNTVNQLTSNYSLCLIESIGTNDILNINDNPDLNFLRLSNARTATALISSFTGTPRKATVTISPALPDTSYNVQPEFGSFESAWRVENKTVSSFDFLLDQSTAPTADINFLIFKI